MSAPVPTGSTCSQHSRGEITRQFWSARLGRLVLGAVVVALTSCGGGGGGGAGPIPFAVSPPAPATPAPDAPVSPAAPDATYAVSGNVSGLLGSGLVLQNNAGDDLPIAANGNFSFP